MENAYNYIINAGGLQSTSDYPYTALDGSCKFNKSQVKVQVESFHKIEEKEESLKEAVDKVGPISVAVNATYWQLYKGGIFNIS